jgi:hypothetical protein
MQKRLRKHLFLGLSHHHAHGDRHILFTRREGVDAIDGIVTDTIDGRVVEARGFVLFGCYLWVLSFAV